MRLLMILVSFVLASFACIAEVSSPLPTPPSAAPAAALDAPATRAHDAPSGSQFAKQTAKRPGFLRQRAAVAELQSGNIPQFLRTMRPVRISGLTADRTRLDIIFWVTPDYMSIGTDQDFMRVPLGFSAAVKVANAYKAILPTRKMVDAIYEQASCRLKPAPLPPGPKMTSNSYFLKHRDRVEKDRRSHCRPAELVAGHKKDVVISKRLRQKPGRVAIYGWHRKTGDPIQPLSTVHGAEYADYSHGIRLVAQTIMVNGQPVSIFEALKQKDLARLLTYEGQFEKPRELMRRKS